MKRESKTKSNFYRCVASSWEWSEQKTRDRNIAINILGQDWSEKWLECLKTFTASVFHRRISTRDYSFRIVRTEL